MLQVLENFLTPEECDYFISLIDENHQTSTVTAKGEFGTVDTKHRTSSTCHMSSDDEKVSSLKQRIADLNGYDVSTGESLQGQLYEPGQFFKPHYDWFDGTTYDQHCLSSGNRIKTFMIYLNDDFEGGETNFPNLGRKIKAKKGSAVVWDNMKDGETIEDVLHEGVEVESGKKYIITSWWRENTFNNTEDARLYQEKNNQSPPVIKMKSLSDTRKFSSHEDLPKFHKQGFEVLKVPDLAWSLINDLYKEVESLEMEEVFAGKEHFLPHESGGVSSTIMDIGMYQDQRDMLHHMLRPIHEQFCGQSLLPSYAYGIRSYQRGAGLLKHRDRIETHHISSIIMVDKDLACGCIHKPESDDWPLNIQSHDGNWHEVYLQPGEMVLYESASCEHGREVLFGGTYFRNLFLHYQLKHYEYVKGE